MTQQNFNQLYAAISQFGHLDYKPATWAGANVQYMSLIPKGDFEAVLGELTSRYPDIVFNHGQSVCNNIIKDAIVFYLEVTWD